jgi:hypothetical protein
MPAVIGRAAEALSLVADAVREALATA